MAMQIRKAERRKAKLRLALIGPTGSGKTYSALQMAFGLGGRVGMIDTENGSGDLYANVGEYDIITLTPPYTVDKYREAIRAFEDAGYDVIIIDSLSHAWAGEGGLLDKSGQLEKSGRVKNSFAAWRELTPEHNKLVEEMTGSPCHIIATMRVKTDYVLEPNEKGKMVPRKVGLAPIQRDGLEYEFTVVMDVDAGHVASASKDRTQLFDGWYDRISPEVGKRLLDWLNTGHDALPQPPEPPKKMSVAEWLEALDHDVKTAAEASNTEALRAILVRDDVKAAQLAVTGKAADRLHDILVPALKRAEPDFIPAETEEQY
jgi:hypothetical protein